MGIQFHKTHLENSISYKSHSMVFGSHIRLERKKWSNILSFAKCMSVSPDSNAERRNFNVGEPIKSNVVQFINKCIYWSSFGNYFAN